MNQPQIAMMINPLEKVVQKVGQVFPVYQQLLSGHSKILNRSTVSFKRLA